MIALDSITDDQKKQAHSSVDANYGAVEIS